MPLIDRQDFRAWLVRRNMRMVGRRHGGDPSVCTACGDPLNHQINSTECMACLAEQFGTETAELWLAEAIAGFIRAAADPHLLAHMLGELVHHGREIATNSDQSAVST